MIIWDGDDSYSQIYPDEKRWVLIRLIDNQEYKLPEKKLKEMFGNRWGMIQLGHDKEYQTYPIYD